MTEPLCADCGRDPRPNEDTAKWYMGIDGEDWLGICPKCSAQDYCGCCGNKTRDAVFCAKCTSSPKHLGSPRLHAWDRTYEATHGAPCPFGTSASGGEQVGVVGA
jgi:hypothetical protein